MVKRWPTPQVDRPGSHLEFFLKMQHVNGQKMTAPQYDRPGSHLEFFLKMQHVHGLKMTNPPVWQARISPRIFFRDATCAWSKDDQPPRLTGQDLT